MITIQKQPTPFRGEYEAENGNLIRFNGSSIDSAIQHLLIEIIQGGENAPTLKSININIGDGSTTAEAIKEFETIAQQIQNSI